jgi:hypothetical protein
MATSPATSLAAETMPGISEGAREKELARAAGGEQHRRLEAGQPLHVATIRFLVELTLSVERRHGERQEP